MSAHLPEALRRELERDAAPVRPLRPPHVRALLAALWAALAIAAVAGAAGVRAGTTPAGRTLEWAGAVAEALAGLLLVWLALRESVPGAGIGRGARRAALAAGIAAQLAVGVLTWVDMGAAAAGLGGAVCVPIEWALALPALVLTLVLAARALPVRPAWAGALAGVGSGLIADAAWHLHCPVADARHMAFHLTALVTLTVAGALAGFGLRRLQARRMH